MFKQFKFEEPIYRELEQIPISTRFKLEMLGLEFPQDIWEKLPLAERWVFCHLSIRSRGERECYTDLLSHVLQREGRSGLPGGPSKGLERKPWEDLSRLPSEVAEKMRSLNLPLFWPEWIKLDDIERYAVFKLCRDHADDAMVQQAVQEFLGVSTALTLDP